MTSVGGYFLVGKSNSGVSGNRTQASQGETAYWPVKVAPENNPRIAAQEATMVIEPDMFTDFLTAYPNHFRDRVIIKFSLPRKPKTVLITIVIMTTSILI